MFVFLGMIDVKLHSVTFWYALLILFKTVHCSAVSDKGLVPARHFYGMLNLVLIVKVNTSDKLSC